jgi:ankyrin repeat protein
MLSSKQNDRMRSEGRLGEAIDELYRTFDCYPRPKWFLGCACCWNNGEPFEGQEFLAGSVRIWSPGGSRSLRDLSVDELSEVAANVPHLGGDADVFRHYLPRLLEILVTTGFRWPDAEPALGRLNYDARLGSEPWWTWPEAEQRAIARFLQEAWAARLREPPDMDGADLSADSLLCGIGMIVEDVSDYLSKWIAFDEPHAAEHLAQFLSLNSDRSNGRLANGFWVPDTPRAATNMRCVVRWIFAEETILAVMSAIETVRSPSESDALERCFTALTEHDAFGAGPLELAIEAGDLERVRMLLASGLGPNDPASISGDPVWEMAFNDGNDAIAALLVQAGANIDRADRGGQTLLHRVVSRGPGTDDVKRALKLGASPNSVDQHGWTPLHCAAVYGYAKSVQLLCSAGADRGALTKDGKTASDLASTNYHSAVVAILRAG